MHESSGYGKLQVHLPGCRLRDAAFTMSVLLNALGTWTVALVATMCTHAARRGVPGSARPIAGGAAGAARALSPRASTPPDRSMCTRRAPRCPARRPDRPRMSASDDMCKTPTNMMQVVCFLTPHYWLLQSAPCAHNVHNVRTNCRDSYNKDVRQYASNGLVGSIRGRLWGSCAERLCTGRST